MYRQTMILTRPDTSVQFWIQTQPAAYFHLSDSFVTSGQVLDVSKTLSPDGLTYVRIIDFKDQASYDAMAAIYNASFPTSAADRDAYEALHGHTHSFSFSTI